MSTLSPGPTVDTLSAVDRDGDACKVTTPPPPPEPTPPHRPFRFGFRLGLTVAHGPSPPAKR